jgi:hypothetical protein
MPAATMRRLMLPRRPALATSISLLLVGLCLALAACSTSGPSIVASTPLVVTPLPTTAPPTVPAASPTPTPIAGTGPCNPSALAAQITAWDSGAGHRNATVTLTNNGRTACTIRTLATPQLVGGDDAILIAGTPPTSTSVLTLEYLDVVTTQVSVANYCGAAPVPPVTVAFVFPGGEGRVEAAPLSPTDVSGVPPCMGSGSGGQIEMHPFAP